MACQSPVTINLYSLKANIVTKLIIWNVKEDATPVMVHY